MMYIYILKAFLKRYIVTKNVNVATVIVTMAISNTKITVIVMQVPTHSHTDGVFSTIVSCSGFFMVSFFFCETQNP